MIIKDIQIMHLLLIKSSNLTTSYGYFSTVTVLAQPASPAECRGSVPDVRRPATPVLVSSIKAADPPGGAQRKARSPPGHAW